MQSRAAALAILLLLPLTAAAVAKERRIATTDEEAACERKADGVYCGRGLRRKMLYQCESGHTVQIYHCDWGCNPATVTCFQKRKKDGGNFLPR